MSKAVDAIKFMRSDGEYAVDEFRKHGHTMSFLQRNGVSLSGLLSRFDSSKEESDWISEYYGDGKIDKMVLHRRRLAFLKASKKEFREDYGDASDVDFMRLLEVSYTDPKYVLDWSLYELKD